ncbi:MAG TPA: hypothetical protein VN641_04995 [Urbifossiella sp.]|nr:hypothetical protein [Urbifossiella sp.]
MAELDYLCLTILSRDGETEGEFKSRLSAFWTRMLREQPADFEKVYAEAVEFERRAERLGRRYLLEAPAAEALVAALAGAAIEHLPIDADDVYSKYEAAPPEWFWIEH